MVCYNFVMLSGKVMTSPRRQFRPDGSSVIEFPLELNDLCDEKKKKGKIQVVAIGELAEAKSDLLECGKLILVKGRLNQRFYQTPEGRKRISYEVIATDLKSLDEVEKTKKLKGVKR